ncbi:hypothetical protein ACQ856_18295 [Mycolicibacterium psychrotolerans]|uniref:hypothetical protein n=1 Tax=Mycolicibacterium psychrotolerans TaxID=216929 RepID=UPI003D67127D
MPSRSRGAKLTTTQKGLGGDHQANRERLLHRHVNGKPCWWCGEPMYREKERNPDGFALEADHSRKRATHGNHGNRADRLLHKLCNIARNTTPDDQRPALLKLLKTQPAEPNPNDLGPLAMAWPDTWKATA